MVNLLEREGGSSYLARAALTDRIARAARRKNGFSLRAPSEKCRFVHRERGSRRRADDKIARRREAAQGPSIHP